MDAFESEGAPDARMEAVRFVGSTLSQFFLNDPSSGAIDAGIEAMAALDADAAASEWPFVEETEARRCLTLMREGALQREADGGEALKWEYRRLFVGPQSLPVPPWSGHMLEQLEKAADHPFYKGLAAITRASLSGMEDAFELEVVEPRFYR